MESLVIENKPERKTRSSTGISGKQIGEAIARLKVGEGFTLPTTRTYLASIKPFLEGALGISLMVRKDEAKGYMFVRTS